jgi:CBS domain containing-hemolysin-like protein
MVPRSEIVSISLDAGLDEVLELMRQHQLSRIPVYEGKPEKILGIVHYKDFLTVWHDRRAAAERRRPVPGFHIRYLMTKPPFVPETKPVNQLVDDFRTEHSHMALVVDEFGSVVGLVTLEDALEQIFGEIEDEHDVHLPPVTDHSPVVELEGGANIRDLEVQYDIELPVDAGFETLAGFVLHRLGRIPNAGDTVEYENYRFTVLSMDRNRIAKIRVERFETDTGKTAPPD